MKSIKLKIGRHEYVITEDDVFVNNGACVVLATQSKERSDWGYRPAPILSKKAIKQISLYQATPAPGLYEFVEFSLTFENKDQS